MAAEVEDTYAEAFRSLYAEVLITARDRRWLDHAVSSATGNASSTIMCDCEAGLDRYVGPGGDQSFPTPDNFFNTSGVTVIMWQPISSA